MYQYNVNGMSCMSCVNHIEKAIKAVDSTSAVEVKLRDGIVNVSSKENLQKIQTVIEEEGYTVTASREI
ncbi:MAG: heavy-metal-associated domain-containing protein [Bacteriovoracia bacterium]